MPTKWDLLRTIEAIRTPLGLRGTSISVLRALLSYLPGDHIDLSRDDGHICFASNTALAQRAHVSIPTVERHIKKLVELGLINRRSSGNGKRWARRNRQGQVTLATGICIAPLLRKHPEFQQMEDAHEDMAQQIAELRDRCRIMLAQLRETAPDLVLAAQKILRRRLTLMTLKNLKKKIVENMQTDKMRDKGNEIEGHKEPELESVEKIATSNKVEVSADQMERSYPRLCNELRTAKTHRECQHILDQIADHLGLGNTWFELKNHGPTQSFMMLGYVLERITTIKQPKAYIKQLLRKAQTPNFNWYALLTSKASLQGHLRHM